MSDVVRGRPALAVPAEIRAFLRREGVGIVSLSILLTVLACVLTTAILSPQKDDVAWLLYVARKWLGGQRLYEDLVEVNPPLIIWLYAIPAWAANWLGAAPKLIAGPFFAALLLASAWWTAVLLQGRAFLFEHRLPTFGLVGTVLLVLPGVEFGQREHLLIAAVLPYIVLFTRELEGEREPVLTAMAAGILAGLGCALKPNYALAFVLMELIGAARGRRLFRVASLSAGTAIVAYGVGVVLFCPAFLEKAVPLALALYGGTDTSAWEILGESRRLLFGQAVALVLCWCSRNTIAKRSPFLRHLLMALTAFAVGSTIVFVMQGKNWFYHRLPATIATVLALVLWIVAMMPRRIVPPGINWPAIPWQRLAVPLPLALVALIGFGMSDYTRMKPWVEDAVEPEHSTEVKIERLLKREKAKTYIAFSEWIALGFPVVNNTGVTWASRFDSMWALKGELWRARQDGAAPKEWPIRRWVAKDFVMGCPDIAVVDAREGINYVAVLVASDAEFAQAWSHYHQIAAFDGLRVLKRDEAGCTSPTAPPPRMHLSVAAMEPP